ncbi:MAG: helix-turn-helix transcriptional regulator [Kiritimatiellae bacterium]|nr:helix-turn-helix transcriptional regulator [Kiritimatiellia bacterium]
MFLFRYRKNMSILGDRLRELRGATSQSEMARELEMARPQWIRYENGTSIPGADILEKICRVHACSADWLLGLKDNAPTVSAGPGAAVAIGSHAKATSNSKLSTPASLTPNCTKCPHLKKLKKLEALLKK